MVFNISYKKIGIARSHSCVHRYTFNLFVIAAGERKTVKRKTSSARWSSVSKLGSLTMHMR